MTRTTEQLRERIRGLEITLQHKNWEAVKADLECLKELLAVREAQPVEVTDEMAMAFHRALTDSDIGSDDLDDIKIGLRGALCNYTAPPAPAVPADVIGTLRLALDAMEFMGNTLNELDAATPDGIVRVSPAFSAVREMLAAAPTPTKPEAGGND